MSDAGHLDDSPATGAPGAGSAVAEDADATIAAGRGRIDKLDRAIIDLIEQRIAVSREIQQARMGTGGRRIELSREMEVLARYRESLGKPGAGLAMTILELCRGRA